MINGNGCLLEITCGEISGSNSLSEFQDVKSVNEGKEKLEAGMCEKTVLEILSNTAFA